MPRMYKRTAAQKRTGNQARRRYVRKGNRVSNKFAKRVLAVVRRTEETKYVANDFDSQGVAHPTSWNPTPNMVSIGSIVPAIPQLGAGVGDFQRVGQKISPVSISCNLRIGFNPTDLSANSLIGVIYYGTSKGAKTWEGQIPLSSVAMLDNGDGTNVGWTGLRNQLNLPIDRTLVTLKRITFRLSKTAGIQNSDMGLPATVPGNYATSNGLSEKSFNLRFRAPRVLSYNQQTDLYPQNYAPFYFVGFCHADGSVYQGEDLRLVAVNSRVHMRFKDS